MFFLFFFASLHAGEEQALHSIVEAKISNAEWQTSRTGTPPKLLWYDLTVTLDNGQTIESKKINADLYPISSYELGETIKINKESLFYKNPNQSWYLIENMAKGQTLTFFGTSTIKPIYEYTDAFPLIILHEKQVEECQLHFSRPGDPYYPNPGPPGFSFKVCEYKKKLVLSLKGCTFTIDDNHFLGIYDYMPVKILEEKIISQDNGLQRVKIKGINPATFEIFEFLSDEYSQREFIEDSSFAQILKIKTGEWTEEINWWDYRRWRTINVWTTKGFFQFSFSNTGDHGDVGDYWQLPFYDNEDYSPKEGYDFYQALAIGKQLVILDEKSVGLPDGSLILHLDEGIKSLEDVPLYSK
jgi:hypothetical protein